MNKTQILSTAMVVIATMGCQRQSAELEKRLDRLEGKIDTLTSKIEKMPAGGGMGQRPAPPPGPDPTSIYAVDVSGDPCKGPANAKVTVVEAADYACPFCQRVGVTMEELTKAYPNDVRVCWKDYVVHPQTATVPAQAACAAQQQGKFWEMNHAIYEKAFGKGQMDEAKMAELANELKLDSGKFKTDMASDKCKNGMQEDMKVLAAVGVRGTPAFYINGRYLSGAQPIDSFKKLVDEELKKADDAIKNKGVNPADYYSKEVVGKGKKTAP